MHKSTIVRAQQVRRLVAEHYEPGRQDRCKLWVWRNIVYPRYGISRATFFRYLGEEDTYGEDNQLSLF